MRKNKIMTIDEDLKQDINTLASVKRWIGGGVGRGLWWYEKSYFLPTIIRIYTNYGIYSLR